MGGKPWQQDVKRGKRRVHVIVHGLAVRVHGGPPTATWEARRDSKQRAVGNYVSREARGGFTWVARGTAVGM